MMSKPSVSDVELVTYHFVRNQYESKQKRNVPAALNYLILSFSQRVIGCKMLSLQQDLHFYELLHKTWKTKNGIKNFHLLYTASENEYTAKSFHKQCDNKHNTITIIRSSYGNLFGGYCSIPWSSSNQYVRDNNSFLFLIQSKDTSKNPPIFKLSNPDSPAIYHDENLGPTFGAGYDIVIRDKCNKKLNKSANLYTSCYSRAGSFDIAKTNLPGGKKRVGKRVLFQVIEYQVIQVIFNKSD